MEGEPAVHLPNQDENSPRRVPEKMLDEDELPVALSCRASLRYQRGWQGISDSLSSRTVGDWHVRWHWNWRDPVWMPTNALIIRALLPYYGYYGDDLVVECPTGSGQQMNLYQVAEELERRVGNVFLRDSDEKHRLDPV